MSEKTLEETATEIEKNCIYNFVCKNNNIPRDICPIFRDKLAEVLKSEFEEKYGAKKITIIQ